MAELTWEEMEAIHNRVMGVLIKAKLKDNEIAVCVPYIIYNLGKNSELSDEQYDESIATMVSMAHGLWDSNKKKART